MSLHLLKAEIELRGDNNFVDSIFVRCCCQERKTERKGASDIQSGTRLRDDIVYKIYNFAIL